ncbi:MAG: hypothetical protein U5K51_16985 [Flavobacteriaceae bacterium]|nr:hypothetical protein [Flavobacteriaceae bacterium]
MQRKLKTSHNRTYPKVAIEWLNDPESHGIRKCSRKQQPIMVRTEV